MQSDKDLLVESISGMDIVVSAASIAQFTETIARACMEAKCDYLDIQYSNSKVKILKSMTGEIESSGQYFISEAGFHPRVAPLHWSGMRTVNWTYWNLL